MTTDPPTSRQLNYLRRLAQRTGQTFTWPQTKTQASRQIQRLLRTPASTNVERHLERCDLAGEQAAREANCDVPIQPSEITGYGAGATWSRRS